MKYGLFPGIDKKVSRLVQGTEMFKDWQAEQALALLDTVFERGCTTFDTAHLYGQGRCEEILGRWIQQRQNRDQVVIITKGAHHDADRRRVTPGDVVDDLQDSLYRLGTEYVDLYLLHRDDPTVPVGPIMEELHRQVAIGRVRAIGASNWTHERIEKANEYAAKNGGTKFSVTSPHFSLAVQQEPPWVDCVSITGDVGASAREWYRANGMPVLSWASLSLGFMSGRISRADMKPPGSEMLWVRSFGTEENFRRLDRAEALGKRLGLTIPQIAVAYVLNQPLDVFPIIASANVQEFEANQQALGITLTRDELSWLNLETR